MDKPPHFFELLETRLETDERLIKSLHRFAAAQFVFNVGFLILVAWIMSR